MPINRRQFMHFSTAAGAALVANPLEAFARPLKTKPAAADYQLLILATNWGFQGGWEAFAEKIKKDGYDGAELWYPADEADRKAMLGALEKHDLKLAFLTGGWENEYEAHFATFEKNLRAASSLKPLYINCHSGKDFFSAGQNEAFIKLSLEVSQASGVPIYHETHRSRILYAAPVARQMMEKTPGLRLTLDISHWCNVHESLLDNQKENIDLALSRTDHIHARIGHAEGPQVNDPRAPEWKAAVEAHFGWWDQVVERKKKEGKVMTFLTEFGPAGYLPTLPYTRVPVADQWEINKYMLDILRKRYA